MYNPSLRSIQRQLLEVGLILVRIENQRIVLWSTDWAPRELIEQTCHRFAEDHQLIVPWRAPDMNAPYCSCGKKFDVLYVNGSWQCSTCNVHANQRRLKAIELLERLKAERAHTCCQ